jgi:hypothetical protein
MEESGPDGKPSGTAAQSRGAAARRGVGVLSERGGRLLGEVWETSRRGMGDF